jgi:hypothetical protein
LYSTGSNPLIDIFDPTGNGIDKEVIKPYVVTVDFVVLATVTELVEEAITVNVPLYSAGVNPLTDICDPTGNITKDCVVKYNVTAYPFATIDSSVVT